MQINDGKVSGQQCFLFLDTGIYGVSKKRKSIVFLGATKNFVCEHWLVCLSCMTYMARPRLDKDRTIM